MSEPTRTLSTTAAGELLAAITEYLTLPEPADAAVPARDRALLERASRVVSVLRLAGSDESANRAARVLRRWATQPVTYATRLAELADARLAEQRHQLDLADAAFRALAPAGMAVAR
ncbi:hypothetical protein FH609_004305 [Streptomyces sp. 3MP-14]|uniref:Uncharacterized protein n=1 Tax=Streptomyces mimosae TaxID=2586635 RepID=A0A5N6A2F3_9ACTN|nr:MULTISPECIES: hypothetical protein [Streptomyces]KAB8162954.1 hypothetical protein FH607_020165 [Streptomyces mimosae]KAB8179168.1 hypothetical protein FH609_004305 [Streptomyces sp. 3MP-14]